MYIVILFGPPGSGKGTQSVMLAKKYSLKHLSTGDLLRNEIKTGSALGKEIAERIDKGKYVSDELIQKMVEAYLRKNRKEKGFVFDGFPRTEAQAEWLKLRLAEYHAAVNAFVGLSVDDNELIKRLLDRGKVSGRPDDKDETMVKGRIDLYNQLTKPVINYYKKRNKYHKVNGVGSLNEVFERICGVISITQ